MHLHWPKLWFSARMTRQVDIGFCGVPNRFTIFNVRPQNSSSLRTSSWLCLLGCFNLRSLRVLSSGRIEVWKKMFLSYRIFWTFLKVVGELVWKRTLLLVEVLAKISCRNMLYCGKNFRGYFFFYIYYFNLMILRWLVVGVEKNVL